MGCPHGPTSSDFHQSHAKNNFLSKNRVSNPVFYVEYEEDS